MINLHTFIGAKVASSFFIAAKASLLSSSAAWVQRYGRHAHTRRTTRHKTRTKRVSPIASRAGAFSTAAHSLRKYERDSLTFAQILAYVRAVPRDKGKYVKVQEKT